MEKIPVVNEQDEIIGYKERYETTREDIQRIVGLCVFNEKGEVLIAKRGITKKIDPDKWGPSVAGTVAEGFEYDDTVVKEAEEEIGLKDITPTFLKKYFYETENTRRFASMYYVVINSNTEFILEKDAVAEVKWINPTELEDWVNKKPEDFTPNFLHGSLANIKEITEVIKK
ncbi:MAG TPA: NUDIX domain-containing protein [Candidatus Paceibacterota bacterium]